MAGAFTHRIGVAAASGASEPTTDGFWSAVTLLMGFDSGYIEERFGLTVTENLASRVTSPTPPYGSHWLEPSPTSTGQVKVTKTGSEFYLSGDFTLEFTVQFDDYNTATGDASIMSQGTQSGNQRAWQIRGDAASGNRIRIDTSPNGSTAYAEILAATDDDAAAALATGVTYKCAIERYGNDWTIFINGSPRATVTNATAVHNSTANLMIGVSDEVLLVGQIDGRMDELRITQAARYHGVAYTPRTTIFPRAGGTALSIAGTPITAIDRGENYESTFAGQNGAGYYTYSVASGSPPPGVELNASTGVLSGLANTAGAYSGIVIRVTDAVGATADTASFTITVSASGSGNTFDSTSIKFDSDTHTMDEN